MFRSLLLKECIKLRAFMLAVLAFNLCVTGYVHVSMRKFFLMDHAEMVWYRVMHLGLSFYDPLMYACLLTGVFLAAAQFLPETRNHRFRISLHLPLPPHLVVLGHIVVGLAAVAGILALDLAALCAMTAVRFPHEVVMRTLTTVLPWALAGLTAYLGTGLLLLEPTWRLRIVDFLISAGVTGLFLRSGMPGAYAPILPWLFLLTLVFIPSVLYPAYRFRYRKS